MFNEVSTFSCSNHQSPEIQPIIKSIYMCEYGCGNEAKFKLGNGKWCCSKSSNSCSAIRKKNSDKIKQLFKDNTTQMLKDTYKKRKEICPICNKELFAPIFTISKHINACKKKEEDKLKIYKKICPKCGKEFELDHFHRFNICCSKSCARSIATVNNKIKKKIIKCKECNSDIQISINASLNNTHLCKQCFPKYYKITKKTIKKKRKCKICGQLDCIQPDICKKRQIIPALIKYFNFDKDVLGTLKVIDEYTRIKDMLYKDYHVDKLSSIEMMLKYKHHNTGNFNKILNSIGIKLRTVQEANVNYILSGKSLLIKCTIFKHGVHTTWNGENVYYRSSYELDYAKELDLYKIDYNMEKLRIMYYDSQKNKKRVAIPDFYLPDSNTIVEIKSTYTLNLQNMKDRVKSYLEAGYKFKLILEHQEVNIDTL